MTAGISNFWMSYLNLPEGVEITKEDIIRAYHTIMREIEKKQKPLEEVFMKGGQPRCFDDLKELRQIAVDAFDSELTERCDRLLAFLSFLEYEEQKLDCTRAYAFGRLLKAGQLTSEDTGVVKPPKYESAFPQKNV